MIKVVKIYTFFNKKKLSILKIRPNFVTVNNNTLKHIQNDTISF